MISSSSGVLWVLLFMIGFCVPFDFFTSLCGRLNNRYQRFKVLTLETCKWHLLWQNRFKCDSVKNPEIILAGPNAISSVLIKERQKGFWDGRGNVTILTNVIDNFSLTVLADLRVKPLTDGPKDSWSPHISERSVTKKMGLDALLKVATKQSWPWAAWSEIGIFLGAWY